MDNSPIYTAWEQSIVATENVLIIPVFFLSVNWVSVIVPLKIFQTWAFTSGCYIASLHAIANEELSPSLAGHVLFELQLSEHDIHTHGQGSLL